MPIENWGVPEYDLIKTALDLDVKKMDSCMNTITYQRGLNEKLGGLGKLNKLTVLDNNRICLIGVDYAKTHKLQEMKIWTAFPKVWQLDLDSFKNNGYDSDISLMQNIPKQEIKEIKDTYGEGNRRNSDPKREFCLMVGRFEVGEQQCAIITGAYNVCKKSNNWVQMCDKNGNKDQTHAERIALAFCMEYARDLRKDLDWQLPKIQIDIDYIISKSANCDSCRVTLPEIAKRAEEYNMFVRFQD
ncbi:hypothetical protein [Vibrio coralliilyticus]|uniref:hypothetical protein n=1 Tax=Vibrio coralliilyticus TaxID=190893 RepID=UPI00031952CD|nr:hypothetical protein [Vibrio coralliilyticus]